MIIDGHDIENARTVLAAVPIKWKAAGMAQGSINWYHPQGLVLSLLEQHPHLRFETSLGVFVTPMSEQGVFELHRASSFKAKAVRRAQGEGRKWKTGQGESVTERPLPKHRRIRKLTGKSVKVSDLLASLNAPSKALLAREADAAAEARAAASAQRGREVWASIHGILAARGIKSVLPN